MVLTRVYRFPCSMAKNTPFQPSIPTQTTDKSWVLGDQFVGQTMVMCLIPCDERCGPEGFWDQGGAMMIPPTQKINGNFTLLLTAPFCKWFWSAFWVPKHLLTGHFMHYFWRLPQNDRKFTLIKWLPKLGGHKNWPPGSWSTTWMSQESSKVLGSMGYDSPTCKWGIPWGEITYWSDHLWS